jgi:hypothetical protein
MHDRGPGVSRARNSMTLADSDIAQPEAVSGEMVPAVRGLSVLI